MYKNLVMILAIGIFIVGCGGGGSTTTNSNSAPNNTALTFSNHAELGTIVGGNVKISSLDGNTEFYQAQTDQNGSYQVNPVTLLSNIDSMLSSRPTHVLVTVSGGTDIDVDDNGIPDEDGGKPLLGMVKGIFKLETLTSEGDLYINLLSTSVAEVLKNDDKIDDEKIAYTAKKLGVKDINDDGVIDNKDLYQYRMVENNSTLEETLRTSFLPSIHENNTSGLIKITDELISKHNIIDMKYNILSTQASISFKKSREDSKLYYGVNLKQNELFTEVYSSPVTLEKNDYLVYKECVGLTCTAIQLVAFDGTNVARYFIQSLPSNVYYDVAQMNNLRATIIDETKQLKHLDAQIAENNSTLNQYKIDIATTQSKIDAIDSIPSADYL